MQPLCTFSILSRIEWAVTYRASPKREGMDLTFSILSRIEWAVTPLEMFCRNLRLLTFSILSRIEWAVTKTAGTSPARPLHFQYPLSDRVGCNRSD